MLITYYHFPESSTAMKLTTAIRLSRRDDMDSMSGMDADSKLILVLDLCSRSWGRC